MARTLAKLISIREARIGPTRRNTLYLYYSIYIYIYIKFYEYFEVWRGREGEREREREGDGINDIAVGFVKIKDQPGHMNKTISMHTCMCKGKPR